jgi:hypothetical protein
VKVAKIFVGVSEHNVICFSLCPWYIIVVL